MNYIHSVERPNGSVKEVVAQANGVYLTFRRTRDGTIIRTARSRPGMSVGDSGSTYVPRDHYAGLIKQVYGVFKEKPTQMGFDFVKEA